MHQVYSAANVIDAQLVCDMLIEEGIEALVRGGYLSGAAGEIPVDSLISVWIKDEQSIQRARGLVTEFEQAARKPAHPRVCPQCSEQSTSHFTHCWNCGNALMQ